MDTSEKLIEYRNENGLTQSELADKLGCSQQRVSEWERGEHEPSNAYRKLIDLEITN